MAYVNSQAFAGRGTKFNYSTNPPSVAYTQMAEIKTIGFSGQKFDLSDVTNMQSGNFKEWLATLGDSGDIALTGNLIPNDATAVAVIGFFQNATLVTYQVVLPAGPGYVTSEGTYTFTAYVQSVDYTIPVEKEATISLKLKITGKITFSAGS